MTFAADEEQDHVTVQTVTGPVPAASLGLTLIHEHLFTDNRPRASAPRPGDSEGSEIAEAPLDMAFLGRLRYEPLLSRDNCVLDDVDLAIEEVNRFRQADGATIVDQTPMGMGRDVAGLRAVSEATGINIVAGSGYYVQAFHPPDLAAQSIEAISDQLIREVTIGTDGVHAGIIGEIGVSADFTPDERRVLSAAGRAQRSTSLPISVHLPGWCRYGHEVLDILEAEGVDPAVVVLSHMNPSIQDPDYQRALAKRGAWLSFDMLGIDWFFGHQGTQSPSDPQVAEAVVRLIDHGLADRILLSGDTFMKMQLRRFGGYGYDHIPARFIPRLHQMGVPADTIGRLVVDNPANVFSAAAES